MEEWLYWQMANLGPNCGQAHHFRNYAQEKIQYAIDRYTNEVNRLYGVMNTRLKDRAYLAGDYSIADMASYPWVRPYKNQGQDIAEFPNLEKWFQRMHDRPAVAKAVKVGEELRRQLQPGHRQGSAEGPVRPARAALMAGCQFSSLRRAGSGLRPVTRSSAMAESTLEAIVFLLGSRSGSAAWAGATNPLESGWLLAQPASSAPARMSIAPRNAMTVPPVTPSGEEAYRLEACMASRKMCRAESTLAATKGK